MPIDIDALENLPLLQGLDTTELEEVAAQLQVTDLAAGEEVIREGDPPSHPLYILIQGSVDVVKRGMDGRGHVITSLAAPSVFGEVEALVHCKAIAGVTASTAGKVAALKRGVFDEMCKANRSAALKLVRNLAQTLSHRLAATDAKLAAQFDLAQPGDRDKIEEVQRVLHTGS